MRRPSHAIAEKEAPDSRAAGRWRAAASVYRCAGWSELSVRLGVGPVFGVLVEHDQRAWKRSPAVPNPFGVEEVAHAPSLSGSGARATLQAIQAPLMLLCFSCLPRRDDATSSA